MHTRFALLILLASLLGSFACKRVPTGEPVDSPAPPLSPVPEPERPRVQPVVPELEGAALGPFVGDLAKAMTTIDAGLVAEARTKAADPKTGVAAAWAATFAPQGPLPTTATTCQNLALEALDGAAATQRRLATSGLQLPALIAGAHAGVARALGCLDEIVRATHDAQMAKRRVGDMTEAAALDGRIQTLGGIAQALKMVRGAYATGLERLLGAVSPAVRYHTIAAVAKSHAGIPIRAMSSLVTRISLARAAERDAGVRQAMSDRIDELRAAVPRPAPRMQPTATPAPTRTPAPAPQR